MNILILTGKFGMGHWSASQSLRQQLLHSFPDARVEVEDFLTYAMPNLAETMYKGFNMVVTYGSHLFNAYYKITAMGNPDARPPFEGLLLDKLTELLHQYQPDAVIATHPLCAQLVSRLKEQARAKGAYGLDLPLITCVTDVSSHPEWINQNTDCYLVASREVRQELVKKGVEASLICVTGIPVREEFRHLERSGRIDEEAGENFAKDGVRTGNTKVRERSGIDCYRMESIRTNEEKSDAPLRRYEMENGKVTRNFSSGHYGLKSEKTSDSLSWESYDRKGAVANKYMLLGSCGKISTQVKCLSVFPAIAAEVEGRCAIVSTNDRKEKKREVLIMGGGLGLLPKSEDFYDALNSLPNTHITIITGHNVKLRKRLEERKGLEGQQQGKSELHAGYKRHGWYKKHGWYKHHGGNNCQGQHICQGRWENIQVVGYTDQVWKYMSRADLIVTKPGGITLFETIFAQVPILTWPPTLQQEKGNACWLMEEGIGWVAGKKNCVKEIREILMDDERLSKARHRMGQLKEQMKAESLNGLMEVIAKSQGAAV